MKKEKKLTLKNWIQFIFKVYMLSFISFLAMTIETLTDNVIYDIIVVIGLGLFALDFILLYKFSKTFE